MGFKSGFDSSETTSTTVTSETILSASEGLQAGGTAIFSHATSIKASGSISAAGNVSGTADLTANRVSGSARGMTTLGTALFSHATSIQASGSVTVGGTIKHDNSTYGGVTRTTVGVSSLTLPKPNNTSEWVDTTVNLPEYSVLRYMFLEKTTPGVNSNGSLHLSNVALRFGGTTPDSDYDLYYNDWDVPGGSDRENGWNLEGAAGDSDYTGHWVIHFPVDGKSGQPAHTYPHDIWLKVKAVGNASGGTAPVVSLFVVYDTFDLS